ncbi:MAG: SURF1 family protein [Steroidobacteraceae bacterium]|nr:SURF1 family protein [Steroidobacteraceae bacterium]
MNRRWTPVVLSLLGAVGLSALGVWQLQRLEWKLALIDRVEARVHAAPVPAPGPAQWPALNRENAEYLRVRVEGRFLPGRETLVQAVTERGGGFWVMAPLQTNQGFVVLVNRGFVPPEQRDDPASRMQTGPVSITGLVRMTEPGGAFLRKNAPEENRWYSRDVAAITHAQGIQGAIAPYFIDAEADPAADARMPVGGLTVIKFHNSHLQYAITWFALALMVAVFGVRILRHEQHRR